MSKKNPEDSEIVGVLKAALTGMGSKFWWAGKKDEVHDRMVSHVKWLQNNQNYRHITNLHHMRTYGNNGQGISVGSYAKPATGRERVTINVTKSCIDTVSAKLGKNRPACTYVTEDGNSKMRRMAKKRNSFSRGAFYSVDAYRKGPRIVRDSASFGTGIVKVYSFDGKLCSDRIFVDEIYVDDVEAMHGDPRNLFHVKPVAREIAIANYAMDEDGNIDQDKVKAIMSAPRADTAFVIADHNADMIEIYEGWHLPSRSDSGDGRHVICVKGADLFDEEWKRDRFPFARYVWDEPQLGWYGNGLAEELNGIQLEINFIAKRIQEAFRILGVPFVFIEEGSKVNTAALKNIVGQIHNYRGTMPTVQTFQTIHPEQINHLKYLIQTAYETSGVSQASAQSKNPLGRNASGEALRAWDDIDSERFILQGQRYEDFFIDWDYLLAAEAADLAEKSKGSFKVTAIGKKYGRNYLDIVDWKEVDFGDHPCQVKVFPISSLPDTPALKMQTLSEWADKGVISKEDMVDIVDLPDLQKVQSRITGPQNYLDESIDNMLEGGPYEAPEPMQLVMGPAALQRVASAYFDAKRQGEKDENLDKLRLWMAAYQKMMAPPAQPPAPPAPPQAPALPPPGAPPQGNAPPMAA